MSRQEVAGKGKGGLKRPQSLNLFEKTSGAGYTAQLIQFLSSKHEAIRLIPRTM